MTTTSKKSSATQKERLAKLLIQCRNDPILFNDKILCRPPCHEIQKQWAEAVVGHYITAIETGNALGKDWFFGGCIIPWWLYTRPNSLVIVTAPSQTLLGSVTWKELRRSVESCPFVKAGLLPARLTGGIKASPQMLEVKPGWQALGFSTTTIERMSGQHAKNLLVLVGEASGVEDHVLEALDGLKYLRMVLYGNPIRAACGFASMCDRGLADEKNGVPASVAVKYINTPSTASPDADKETSDYGLADKTWLEAMARKWGVDSPWYKAHVLAIRPKLTHEILIQPEWLHRATSDFARRAAEEWRKAKDWDGRSQAGVRRLSCDVGEGVGNARSVVVVRDDVGILEIRADAFAGAHATAQMMADMAEKWRVLPEHMSYDAAGNTGRRLKEALPAKHLEGVHPYFGAKQFGKRFGNMRSATAAALARRLDPDSYIDGKKNDRPFHIQAEPADLQAIISELGELRGTLKGDRFALEDKADFMERLGRSPDFADAITQGFREEAVSG